MNGRFLIGLGLSAIVAAAAMGCGNGDDDGFGGSAQCASVLESFQACGGDISGTWRINTMCSEAYADPDDEESCPGAMMEMRLGSSSNYTLTFSNGRVEGRATNMSIQTYTHMPVECLGGLSCDEASMPSMGFTCSGSDVCSCSMQVVPDEEDDFEEFSGTYTVSGNKLTVDEDDFDEVSEMEFCVRGSTLYLRSIPNQDDPEDLVEGSLVMVGTRR